MLLLIKNIDKSQTIEFEIKCKAFLQAMYSKLSIISIDANIAKN